jgi:hypothetical protein
MYAKVIIRVPYYYGSEEAFVGNMGAGTKIIFAINAVGAVLLVVAISAFVLSGSEPITKMLYPAAGGVMGSGFAYLLTRSRSSGGFVAGSSCFACGIFFCVAAATALSNPELTDRLLERRMGETTFVIAFAMGIFVAALLRLSRGEAEQPRSG